MAKTKKFPLAQRHRLRGPFSQDLNLGFLASKARVLSVTPYPSELEVWLLAF